MRTVAALLLSLLVAAPVASVGASENAGKLDLLVKRYLDGLFRAKPHLATFMGDHRFDGALPPTRRRRREAARGGARRAEEGSSTPSSPPAISATTAAPTRRSSPTASRSSSCTCARSAIGSGTRASTTRSPTTTRARLSAGGSRTSSTATSRPRPSAGSRSSPSWPRCRRGSPACRPASRTRAARATRRRSTPKQGIDANKGNLEFFDNEVQAVRRRRAGVRGRRWRRCERYQTFLEKELLPHADGDWRLGRRALRQEVPARAADEDDAGRAAAARPGRLRRRARAALRAVPQAPSADVAEGGAARATPPRRPSSRR